MASLVDSTTYLPADWLISPLSRLTNLGLRSTKIGDAGLKAILPLCLALQTLDIAYTAVRSLDVVSSMMAKNEFSLHKLSISGLSMRSPTGLERFSKSLSQLDVDRRNALKVLKMGTLDIDNPTFGKMVPNLEKLEGLQRVSLFGNKKLASGYGSGLARFITYVGRNCDVSCVGVMDIDWLICYSSTVS